jgi:required for meiotic nuclear division protein 1
MATAIRKTKNQVITLDVEALYLGESIDLKKTQENLRHWNFLNKDHPLIVKVEEKKFFALTKFGVVVFWGMDEMDRRQVLGELASHIRSRQTVYPYTEHLEVQSDGSGEDYVEDDYVHLGEFTLARIKLVSYALAQSVALERYEDEITSSLTEAEKNIESLKTRGKIAVGSAKLLRQVGQAMSVKQVAVAHLSLFDKPDEAWESPELEKLYMTLQSDFELTDRFDVLNEKISFLSENTRMLSDIVGERRMDIIQIIMTVLCLMDVILFCIDIYVSLK